MHKLVRFIADEVVNSRHLEFYLTWIHTILRNYGTLFESPSMQMAESLRAIIRAVSLHEAEILKMCDENEFLLSFLNDQGLRASAVSCDTISEKVEGDIGKS